MSRAWLGRAAVRAYPVQVRASRGEELVGTLLDAGEHSAIAFCRQLVSVLLAGLATRSRQALGQPPRQIALDVVRWACIVTVACGVTRDAQIIHWGGYLGGSLTTVCLQYVGPIAVLVLFTAGRERATGIVGLIWLAADIHSHTRPPVSLWIELWLPQLAGFAVMAAAPRSRASLERALWLVPALVWAIFWYTELGQRSGVGYLTPVLATLALLPLAPALALGTAFVWSLMAVWVLPIPVPEATRLGIELLSCAPLALILLFVSQRAVRRT